MKKFILLLWPISLLLAYQSGSYFYSPPEKNTEPPFQQQTESNKSSLQTTAKASDAIDSEVSNNILEAPELRLTIEEVVERFGKLKKQNSVFSNDLAHMAEIYQLFKNIPDEQVLAVLQAMPIDEANKNFVTAYGYLLGRYAEQDGESALLFLKARALNKMTKSSLQSSVYITWAKKDSDAAFEHFNHSPDSQLGQFKSIALMGMFNAIAEQNIDLAIDRLTTLNESGQPTTMAVMGISVNFTESYQYQDFMTKLSSLGDDRLIKDTVAMWGTKQPSQAAQWLNDTADLENKPELAKRILSSWAMTDFEQAADWYVSSNFEQKEKQQLITKIIRDTHYRQEPTTLEGWINKQDDIDKNLAVSGLIVNSAYQAPDYAEENIERIVDEKEKIRVAHSIYTSYLRQNKHKAEQYRENSPYKDEIDKQIAEMKSYRKKI